MVVRVLAVDLLWLSSFATMLLGVQRQEVCNDAHLFPTAQQVSQQSRGTVPQGMLFLRRCSIGLMGSAPMVHGNVVGHHRLLKVEMTEYYEEA